MNQSDHQEPTLAQFGDPMVRMERAIADLQAGKGVLVVDDEDRENEGDLIFSAQHLTNEQMAMMIRDCSGIVCLCLTDAHATALELPPMVANNTSSMGTGFTVSIEAKAGVTTGVSAADRTTTVKVATADGAKASDLARPGHVFPLRARPGGVMERRGHTEATVDMMRLAGLKPAGVLCEVTNPDGSMARLPELVDYATRHDMVVISIDDIVAYRQQMQKAAE
ncbi:MULTISPECIES: 3,4-dihydroxy-2-butanone-4-phosphate synthase [unclassified Thalassospira]|jgi:3,4-dihydroxy 2-butanone 4-phosphate synthase|uniref:3,4-dihydroxy-2-butanone-4-phosphate synthase n=1 Tax=unclassified Thalassospira TaxID=2648997 RepID=UPI000A1F74ED|nr:3,4-dihydroxy-2-butanone-4-phosphate synthase [Thalassospira sp. MCCC 1A01428]OSQ37327.1 3,4-dihydroxy-2-butanone 4-phosphate synthase [Thalassospira sp. MCCC 1A01428]